MKLLRPFILVPAVMFCSGIGSCTKPSVEVYLERFPRFDEKISVALAQLEPVSGPRGRAIASESRPMSDAEREQWKTWAEEVLSDAQAFMDIAEQDQSLVEVKKALSRAADDLVAFRGYAGLGKRARMAAMLTRIQESGRAAAEICGGR